MSAQINTTPAAGNLLVLHYPSDYARPSHIAFVEAVNPNGTFLISQQSFGDYSPGTTTKPYPYISHSTWNLQSVRQAEHNLDRSLHFPPAKTPTKAPTKTTTPATTPTQAPASAATNDANVVQNLAGAHAQVGQTFTVQAKFENTGTATWSDASGYELECVSIECLGTPSVRLNGAQVAPNQAYTFTIQLTAPAEPAQINISWMMAQNGVLFGEATPINVLADTSNNIMTLVSQSPDLTADPGQQFSVSFVVKNSGQATWDNAGGYGLMCVQSCMGAATAPVTSSVATGAQVGFTFTLTAPTTPGAYTTLWQMETDGSTGFGP